MTKMQMLITALMVFLMFLAFTLTNDTLKIVCLLIACTLFYPLLRAGDWEER